MSDRVVPLKPWWVAFQTRGLVKWRFGETTGVLFSAGAWQSGLARTKVGRRQARKLPATVKTR